MDELTIGERVRMIRRRRGMSLDVAAGLVGISKPYLSMLETGKRRIDRHGLLEDIANALGCSIADLTGQPYAPVDRATADGLATLPEIRLALNNYQPDESPTRLVRPVDELIDRVDVASAARDQANFAGAGRELGRILLELQAYAAEGSGDTRGRTLSALLEGWIIAAAIANNFGYLDLSLQATRRAEGYAAALDEPWAIGFTRWYLSHGLMRAAARERAAELVSTTIDELEPLIGGADTAVAEMVGLLHLTSAQTAGRSHHSDLAHDHLIEADRIARRTGEQNSLRRHFGPTNVASWTLAVGIELNEGGRAYAQATSTPIDVDALGSRERVGALHLEYARALAQENGSRDADAIRHLDSADRAAPQLIRPSLLAREVVRTLDRRAKRHSWELDSLRNRFGVHAR